MISWIWYPHPAALLFELRWNPGKNTPLRSCWVGIRVRGKEERQHLGPVYLSPLALPRERNKIQCSTLLPTPPQVTMIDLLPLCSSLMPTPWTPIQALLKAISVISLSLFLSLYSPFSPSLPLSFSFCLYISQFIHIAAQPGPSWALGAFICLSDGISKAESSL